MKLVSKQTWFIVWDLLLDHLQFSKNKKIKNKKGEYNTHGHYSVFFGYLLAWFFFRLCQTTVSYISFYGIVWSQRLSKLLQLSLKRYRSDFGTTAVTLLYLQ